MLASAEPLGDGPAGRAWPHERQNLAITDADIAHEGHSRLIGRARSRGLAERHTARALCASDCVRDAQAQTVRKGL
jgi:hypothetical protein